MSKIFFRGRESRKFSKGKSMNIWNFENEFSLISILKIFGDFGTRKHIFGLVFRPEMFDENPYIFLQIVSEFKLA